MSDVRLAHMCKRMKDAIDNGIITVRHDDIDEKGLVPIVQIHSAEDNQKYKLIYFCPWCGVSLGNWLKGDDKCITTDVADALERAGDLAIDRMHEDDDSSSDDIPDEDDYDNGED
jgi:hypothetical protein